LRSVSHQSRSIAITPPCRKRQEEQLHYTCREQLYDLDFLRPDVAQNQPLFAQGRTVELQQGDVPLFHSGLFHSAGRNAGNKLKTAMVFTYYSENNVPVAGSCSAAAGDVSLGW
jgi:phytanoyl-CoA hydroxylase